jgi:hypothetical protein
VRLLKISLKCLVSNLNRARLFETHNTTCILSHISSLLIFETIYHKVLKLIDTKDIYNVNWVCKNIDH